MVTYEELVEKLARAIATNPPLQKFDFDKATLTYDYTAPAKAAMSTIREALSEPDEDMLDAAQSERWESSSNSALWRAMLAASPLVEEERR